MKKLFVIILICICVISGLYAVPSVFIQPLPGTGSIPMSPVRDKDPFFKISYTTGTDKGGWTKLDNPPFTEATDVPAGKYSKKSMIATGGIKDITENDFNNGIKLSLFASCSKGFYFVSQSSPYYRRPFELYVIPRIKAYFKTTEHEYYLAPIVIKEGSPVVEFVFNKDWWPSRKPISVTYYAQSIDMFFDLVMVLPGTVDENHNLIDESNRIFPLTKADDYSSLVDLTMQVQIDGKDFDVSKGTSVPSTGFYNTPVPQESENSISMYIYPSALSGSINMKAYNERQPIADVEVLGINKLSNADDWADAHKDDWSSIIGQIIGGILDSILTDLYGKAPKTSYAVFLSSSPDPFTSGQHFVMKKDNLESSVDTPLTQYNSIPYSVVLVNKASGALDEITYTGEDKYDLTIAKPTFDSKGNPEYSHLFIPSGVQVRATNSTQNNILTFPFKGTAYLVLDDNSSVIMEAGRYVGEVYVHVVNIQ